MKNEKIIKKNKVMKLLVAQIKSVKKTMLNFTLLNIFMFLMPMIGLSINNENDSKLSTTRRNTTKIIWNERNQDKEFKKIQFGIDAFSKTKISYKRFDETIMKVELAEPVVIDVASKVEKWGYFQFPNIYRSISDKETLVCTWHMSADHASSYGKGSSEKRISKDCGKTWIKSENIPLGGGFLLPDGDMINVITPAAIPDSELDLPNPVETNKEAYGRTFSYYRHDDLPEVLKGVYIQKRDKNGNQSKIHATINDPNLVRYTDSGLFPIVWWGDMKLTSDKSIVTGPYPTFYVNEKGGVDPSGVSFYRSTNNGEHWDIIGKIPYIPDLVNDANGKKRLALGFTEPGFEILSDGTFLCVLRTTDGYGDSPMYITRSSDQGVSWSEPKVFTPSGVLPRLLQLENGVLVLASGRPGVQLRFSFDGKGEKWTDPFEMLPFKEEENSLSHTCGYPQLLATGSDRFLIVYSDFKYPIQGGELRKAIKVREVKVSVNNIKK